MDGSSDKVNLSSSDQHKSPAPDRVNDADTSMTSDMSRSTPHTGQQQPPSATPQLFVGCADNVLSPINPFDSPKKMSANDNNTSCVMDTRGGEADISTNTTTPMNPFDSPKSKQIHEGGGELSKSGTTPMNPFESPKSLERRTSSEPNFSIDDEGGEKAESPLTTQSKCRLDEMFGNDISDDQDHDYSQYADINVSQQERGQATSMNMSTERYQEQTIEADNIRTALEQQTMNDSCKNDEDEVRVTTSTQGSMLWDDNEDHDHANDEGSNNDDNQSFIAERCIPCLLRLLRRICNPHVYPPCISKLSHPYLPCLDRISPRWRRIICRSLIISFMVVTITFTLLDLLILHQYLHVWLDSLLAWLSDNPVSGGVAFIGVFLVGSLCFFPVALLSLGAGFVYIELYGLGFGIFVAFIVCYLGCLLGAAVCFARSRYLMRQLIQRFSVRYPIVRAVDRAFETMGFRLFFLLRLSPAMPFNALNYIGGITAISFRNYWWATCVGTAPGLLWTIFVGATFGTVNEKGVDGNQEFEGNNVRKGVVLGLGIGLGVVALIGTGIYARKELTKIVIAEQRERALEEQAGVEMPHHLLDGEFEAIPEEEEGSSFEDLENPQQGESIDLENPQLGEEGSHDDRLVSDALNMSASSGTATPPRSDSTSRSGRQGMMRQQRPWTPDAVAAELPIFPKAIRRVFSPIMSLEATISNQFTPDHEDNAEAGSTVVPVTPPASSSSGRRARAHSLPGLNTDIAFMSSRRATDSPLPPINDDISTSLPGIDETKVLSDDDSSKEADVSQIATTPIGGGDKRLWPAIGTRRRCNTDPTDGVEPGSRSPAAVPKSIMNKSSEGREGSVAAATPSPHRKRRQQQLPLWPIKHGLRKRHSFESLGAYKTPPQQQQQQEQELSSSDTDRVPSSLFQVPTTNNQQQLEQPRRRNNSLPPGFEFSPSRNHLEFTIGNGGSDDDDEEEEEPSREWFWIWA